MKFKNILTEAIIDNLDISKLDKGILKSIHKFRDEKGYYQNTKGEIVNTWDLTDGEKLLKVANAIGYDDYDHLYKLYKYYLKYQNVLFDDLPSVELEGGITSEDMGLLGPILLQFYYDNYVGQTFDVDGITWRVDTPMGNLKDAMAEEATYMELFSEGDTTPIVVVYCQFVGPNVLNRGNGIDVISHDDGLSQYNGQYVRKKTHKYDETLANAYIDSVDFPEDLKKETLKIYFDKLIGGVIELGLEPATDIILDYMDHVRVNQPPQ
jgi:hypothetical protein